ncbi:hypothetical protein EVAR_96017_1 [Eumeta japonica]|uniref:Uncharacterized protein n=1 Tax=Eumeta variegata TaxID=151549 RepID=A0A4C1XF19_EUMVA|nr:hypothetical protein EVAR_96017_1 [Eumeta japonica]
MDDKIDDIYKLMKDRRLDILCVNETLRKGVYAPDMSKQLEGWEEFWTEVRDILAKCDRNERIIMLVRKVVSEKKSRLDLLSAKGNHRVQRKDALKYELKDAERTYKDAKM